MNINTYILPFGKHKLKFLKDVPVGYLVTMYKSNIEVINKYPELREYIEAELSSLLIVKDVVGIIPDPLCNKHCYVDEEEAKKALKLIKQDKRIHKKPDRVYLHPVCGFWHLTSKPLKEEENEEQ